MVPSCGAGWRVGSGPYLFAHSAANSFTLIPNPYHPEATRGVSPLEIRIHPDGNARDLLSGSTDVVFMEERSALEYARGFEDWSLHPLAWDRTYFLISADLGYVSLGPEARESLERLRLELSRDVVASVARPGNDPKCPDQGRAGGDVPQKPYPRLLSDPLGDRSARILYPAHDRDAGRLAERLVALALAESQQSASPGSGTSIVFPFPLDLGPDTDLVATGVDRQAFRDALMAGREWALVVSHHALFADSCLDLMALGYTMSWIGRDVPEGSSPVVPLVDTRRHVMLRTGLMGVEMDWDGTVLLNRAGWVVEIDP